MMDQDLKRISNTYNDVSEEYSSAFENEHDGKPKDCEVLNRFASLLTQESKVLDLGCGPGQTCKYLHELGVSISGLDLSEKMVEQARIYHSEITFAVGNMLALDIVDNSIDGILSFYSIVHFSSNQVKKAFNEISRVLKKGGYFLCAFHIGNEIIPIMEFLGKTVDVDFMLFDVPVIQNCLTEAGFEVEETEEREPYPDIEYQSKRAYILSKKLAN